MSVEFRTCFAGGNGIVQSLPDGRFLIEAEQRGGKIDWFYWCVEFFNIETSSLRIVVKRPEHLSSLGPAFQVNGGEWSWLGVTSPDQAEFEIKIETGVDTVKLASVIPYTSANLRAWLNGYLEREDTVQEEELCSSSEGRAVPLLRVRARGDTAPIRVLATCRHHACEASANWVLEGMLDYSIRQQSHGVALDCVPFVDLDGVENGDQGKGRNPHDHNRDYGHDGIYAETKAIQQWLSDSDCYDAVIDLHSPWIRESHNECAHIVLPEPGVLADRINRFSELLEGKSRGDVIAFRHSDNLLFGERWNKVIPKEGSTFIGYVRQNDISELALTMEIPYSVNHGVKLQIPDYRKLGYNVMECVFIFLKK